VRSSGLAKGKINVGKPLTCRTTPQSGWNFLEDTWVATRRFGSQPANGSMSTEPKNSQVANRDVRDGDGPLQVAGHIALVANRLEWVNLDPLNEADIGDNC
jgi:hypothetical protein